MRNTTFQKATTSQCVEEYDPDFTKEISDSKLLSYTRKIIAVGKEMWISKEK
jgi:hypothetical protein